MVILSEAPHRFIAWYSVRWCGVEAASLRACDFFDLARSLWLESWEEHLLTSIAEVLRLRAISRPLCDRSARRFAQDDGFAGVKSIRLATQKTGKDRKSYRLSGQVLRLHAISRPLCDRSARRFAQDDSFVGRVKSIRLATQKTGKDRKRHRLSG